MILKGSQRGGAMQLAKHLMNDHDNDHVEIHAINGFVANDVAGALTEIYAVSKATKCQQFMFSLSLSPPEGAIVTVEDYENAVEQAAEKLGLVDQPHVMLFHEKNGRKHCHAVFSRIETQEMKAINLPFYKERLNDLARELYLTHGWDMPKGFQDRSLTDPLNYTLEEYQVAKRAGRDPREIKATLISCWQQSDSKTAFFAALQEKGFYLCKGSRRGFVALDWQGNIYSLSRWTGEKNMALKAKLGEAEQLLSVEKMQHSINLMMTKKHREFQAVLKDEITRKTAPLKRQHQRIISRQRNARAKQKKEQQFRQWQESITRSKRLRTGLLGLWDWVSGGRRKIVKHSAAEFETQKQSDQQECLHLHIQQKAEQQNIHSHIAQLKRYYQSIRADLKAEFEQWKIQDANRTLQQKQEHIWQEQLRKREWGFEPTLH
jgi:hypothetical protein